uniref:Uncharacterized protein n=1 Tax=Glossina austeni TaxID=7395 RepID=A0A1A9UHL4_GLOAU
MWQNKSAPMKNGNLRNLKKEYERIKDFDDHALELKMREARLKQLFNEIEEIKGNILKKRHLIKINDAKSDLSLYRGTALRTHQNILELKKTYPHKSEAIHTKSTTTTTNHLMSDENAENIAPNKRFKLNMSSRKSQLDMHEHQNKANLMRRLNYGNRISRLNMQRILINNLRKELYAMEGSEERMQQRVNYTSSVSANCFAKIPKRRKMDGIALQQNLQGDPTRILVPSVLNEGKTLHTAPTQKRSVDDSSTEACTLEGRTFSEMIYSCLSSEIFDWSRIF